MIEGSSHTSGKLLHKGPHGRTECGIWRCTPGRWHCHVTRDEFCHFLAGRSTYVHESGEVIEIAARHGGVLSAGLEGRVHGARDRDQGVHDSLSMRLVALRAGAGIHHHEETAHRLPIAHRRHEQMVRAAADGAAATDGVVVTEVQDRATSRSPSSCWRPTVTYSPARRTWRPWPGLMKEFFDRCYYPALERLNGRPYWHSFAPGSDGSIAARQIERIATGWRLRASFPAADRMHARADSRADLAGEADRAAELARCRELGAAMASGLEMGIF